MRRKPLALQTVAEQVAQVLNPEKFQGFESCVTNYILDMKSYL